MGETRAYEKDEKPMPLIQQIEYELPQVALLPTEWQMEIALVISKFIVAYDNTLTMTPAEQRAERDRELTAFQQRYRSDGSERQLVPKGGNDSAVHESAGGSAGAPDPIIEP
jgi:hypothetical protein